MYHLTARMLQRLKKDLGKYHDLFTADRCKGWEQEELIVAAIKSDTSAQHHVFWKEAGHDSEADIRVKANNQVYPIQIKSGQEKAGHLVLSGHRLGRFDGDFDAITNFLKSTEANIISVAYKQINNRQGRQHRYQVSYVGIDLLRNLSPKQWRPSGKAFEQINADGVQFSIRPSMSWQIWWKIPLALVKQETPFLL